MVHAYHIAHMDFAIAGKVGAWNTIIHVCQPAQGRSEILKVFTELVKRNLA